MKYMTFPKYEKLADLLCNLVNNKFLWPAVMSKIGTHVDSRKTSAKRH